MKLTNSTDSTLNLPAVPLADKAEYIATRDLVRRRAEMWKSEKGGGCKKGQKVSDAGRRAYYAQREARHREAGQRAVDIFDRTPWTPRPKDF